VGNHPVAEGPLIRHVPGGTAEWRAKETGLPPARLVKSEDEWWGQLVGPRDAVSDIVAGRIDADTGVDTGDTGIDTGDGGGVYSPAPDTSYEDFYGITQDWDDPSLYWKDVDPKSLYDPTYKGVKTGDSVSPEIPEAFGWGWSYDDKGNIIPEMPSLPPSRGYIDKPSTLEKWGGYRNVGKPPTTITLPGSDPRRKPIPEKPITEKPIIEPPPTKPLETSTYEDWMGFRYYSNPDNQNLIVGAVKDMAGTLKKFITKLVGPTGSDLRGKTESENVLIKALKDFLELSGAYREEVGGPITGGLFWETEGGKTKATLKEIQDQPHFPNIPKTFLNLIKGEEDPIVMQKYGDYHWLAILTYALAEQQYGPAVWTVGAIRTGVPTVMDAINGMFMDHPNMEGNRPQDIAHVSAWILGRATLKMWEITGSKILEKLGREPKPKSRDKTILQNFEIRLTKSIGKLRQMFTGKEPKGEEGEQRRLGPSIKYTPTPSPPSQRPRTIDPGDEHKGEVTKRPLLDMVDDITGAIVGGKPKGEIPTGRGKDKLRELEQEQEELERKKVIPDEGTITPDTGDDEKGKGLGEQTLLNLPYDSFGATYGEPGFDESDIQGWRDTPVQMKEGESEGDLKDKLGGMWDKWKFAQWEAGLGEKPDDPTKEPEPGYNQVRGSDGKIYDKNPNGWKNPSNPSSGLINRNDPFTWNSSAGWDDSVSDLIRGGLPWNHPQHESNRPDWDKPLEGSPGGGGIYADTDFDLNELSSKWTGTQSKFWSGYDSDGNYLSYGLQIQFHKTGIGANATYFYRYSSPEEHLPYNQKIDKNRSDSWNDNWIEWNPGE